MVRLSLAAALIVLAACGASEPNWRNAGGSVGEQEPPPALNDYWISPVTPYEELGDLDAKMRGEGWKLFRTESAGPEFPGKYLVTYRR